jgi:penicillin-binding protein 1C
VCALTGHLAGDNCPSVVTEYLRHDDVPTEPCTAHVRRTVDVRDGLLATARTPARFTREETFVDLPARYAVWQVSAGLSRPPTTPSPLGAHDGAPISAPPAFAVADAPSVRITSPADGTHVIRDVDVPTSAATLALEATVDPPVPQVVWYVDGHPWRTVDWPYATRWPLAAGKHVFEARVPFRDVASPRVTITGQ